MKRITIDIPDTVELQIIKLAKHNKRDRKNQTEFIVNEYFNASSS